MDLVGGVKILQLDYCYLNWDKVQRDEPVSQYTVFPFTLHLPLLKKGKKRIQQTLPILNEIVSGITMHTPGYC